MKALKYPSDCGWLDHGTGVRHKTYKCVACGKDVSGGRLCAMHRNRKRANGHPCLTKRRINKRLTVCYEPPTVTGAALKAFWQEFPLPQDMRP
jgi:hypothetical protein